MWRPVESASIVAASNATYELRAERLTGYRSYIPLLHITPFTASGGRPKRFQSVIATTPAMWAPDECPPT